MLIGTQRKCIGTNCFTDDTLVKTESGLKRIDSIKTGDLVLSKNIITGEISYKPVVNVFKKETKEFVNLIVGGKLIETTPGHLFRLANGEWRAASELKAGDKILDSAEGYKIVESVEKVVYDESRPIYNFTVEEFHTYYVSEDELLVHNDCLHGIAKNTAKHLLSRHCMETMYPTIKYQLENGVKTRQELENYLLDIGFFNKDWSTDKCLSAVSQVYDAAKNKGIITDTFTMKIFGEDITVALTDGILSTAWGTYKYKLQDFGL